MHMRRLPSSSAHRRVSRGYRRMSAVFGFELAQRSSQGPKSGLIVGHEEVGVCLWNRRVCACCKRQ